MNSDVEDYLRRLLELSRTHSAVQSDLDSTVLISLGALDALVATGQLGVEEAARWSVGFRGTSDSSDQDFSSISLEGGGTGRSLTTNRPPTVLPTLERSVIANRPLQALFVFSIELYSDGTAVRWRSQIGLENPLNDGSVQSAVMGRIGVSDDIGTAYVFVGSGSFGLEGRVVRGESIYRPQPPSPAKTLTFSLGDDSVEVDISQASRD